MSAACSLVGRRSQTYVLGMLLIGTSPLGTGQGAHDGQLLDALIPHVIQINVTGPHGSEVTTDKPSIDLAHRTNVSVPLKGDGPGVYMVVWHNVSGDDGDPNDGSFVFSVAGAAPSVPSAACVDNGQVTPGMNDVRVNTYCKRQAIRDKYNGQIDENTFNFELADGVGLEHALADAMAAVKGHRPSSDPRYNHWRCRS